jgi:hypothetical protein
MNFEVDEIVDIKKAVMEFAENSSRSFCEAEFTELIKKTWKKGYQLGYFKLDELNAVEAVSVVEGFHSVNPKIGVAMLYFTVSNYLFGEVASFAFRNDENDDVVSDFAHNVYVLMNDKTNSKILLELVKCTSNWYTEELVRLEMDKCEVLDKQIVGVDFKTKLTTLLAARCIGTAEIAYRDAAKFLREMSKLGKLNFDYHQTRRKLGEIAAELEASRLLTYKSAWKIDKGVLDPLLADISLWKAARTAVMAVDEATIVQEGINYLEDYRVQIFRKYARIDVRSKMFSRVDLRLSNLISPHTEKFWEYQI